jgi:Ca2+/Na+ antiporter
MIKNWLHDIALAVQARSGLNAGLLVWVALMGVASLTAFTFLCVAAYAWLVLQFGTIYAGLIMAGVFIVIALVAALVFAISRRRARERAILERAARAHGASSWLLDPKILGVAMQAGRALGWERIIPVALLGLLAAQWAREKKSGDSNG